MVKIVVKDFIASLDKAAAHGLAGVCGEIGSPFLVCLHDVSEAEVDSASPGHKVKDVVRARAHPADIVVFFFRKRRVREKSSDFHKSVLLSNLILIYDNLCVTVLCQDDRVSLNSSISEGATLSMTRQEAKRFSTAMGSAREL